MLSSTETPKMKKVDCFPQDEGVMTPKKHIIKGYRNFEATMDCENMKYYRVKGIKLKTLEFDERRNQLNVKTIQGLVRIIKSAKGKQTRTLGFDINWWEGITNAGFSYICTSLKRLTGLKCLNLDFSLVGLTDDGLSDLVQCLETLGSLESVNLKFSSTEITNAGLEALCKRLRKLHSLQKITLFLKESQINDEGLRSLRRCLRSFQRLQVCNLVLTETNAITDAGLKHLDRPFRKRAPLRSLNLDFSKCQSMTNKGLGYLVQNFSSYTLIKHFGVHFDKCGNIEESEIQRICQDLQMLPFLDSAKLAFSSCLRPGSSKNIGSLKSIQFQSLKGDHSLSKVFSLSGDDVCITGAGIKKFYEMLLASPSLSKVDVDFRGCSQIGEKEVQALWKTLTKIASLRSLSLNLSTKANLEKMNLDKLTSLQDINFNLSGFTISDLGMEKIVKIFKRNLFLKEVTIDFTRCCKITDVAIKIFAQGFQNLVSLQKLTLILDQCEQLSNNQLIYLGKGLEKLVSLQSFKLSCSGCEILTDNGLKGFSQVFSKLVSLRNMALNFHQCKITDRGLYDLAKGLQTIKSLFRLTFGYYKRDKITHGGWVDFAEVLGSITSLKEIEIAEGGSLWYTLSDKVIRELSALFENNPQRVFFSPAR